VLRLFYGPIKLGLISTAHLVGERSSYLNNWGGVGPGPLNRALKLLRVERTGMLGLVSASMVKDKTKMDPPGVKRMLDVGGPPSSKTNTTKTRNLKQTLSNYLKEKHVTTSTLLHKTPKHKLRTPRITVDEQSSLSPESSSDELSSIWGQTPQIEAEPQIRPPVPTSTNPRQSSPSVAQKLSVTAEVHCSQGGTKVNKDPTEAVPVAETDSVSAPVVPAPSDDEDFTVKISRKNKRNY
jgi:hypothetical protein